MNSFLAGICISLGAYTYLNVGGIMGALLFSVGLLAILNLNLDLFTGRCGKLASREMARIWLGNFLGSFFTNAFWRKSGNSSFTGAEWLAYFGSWL